MVIEIGQAIKTITNLAPKAAPFVINQLQRNETVVKILKELNLDPTQPPKNIDGVYIYSLVEYGSFQPEAILKLLREKEIKHAFWQAYTANQPLAFLLEVEKFLKAHPQLSDELRMAGIEIPVELEKFGEVFVSVAKQTKSSDYEPYPDWHLGRYPREFKSLILEKTKTFFGRQFVFEAFKQFLNKNPKGYFTVVGDAGMGKTAIAAKYVYAYGCPCYFNIRVEGRNRPELFLESLRQQLIKHYQLQNASKDDLPTLLERVSQKLTGGQRLVIVIDALDEIEQDSQKNLLDLPTTPPNGIYFFLTRRPYTPEKKRLSVAPGIPMKELDLRTQYVEMSREDVKNYIKFFLHEDPDYKEALSQWIQLRNKTQTEFIEQVASQSENNFMYLRYFLPDIARGFYDNLNLQDFPKGLQDYYQTHWVRMGLETEPQEIMVIILFILVEIGTPITSEMIADITGKEELEVDRILETWVEYLRKQEIDGEECHSIYHASFLDFLKKKRELKRTRNLFQEVNKRIVDYFQRVQPELKGR